MDTSLAFVLDSFGLDVRCFLVEFEVVPRIAVI